jgi:neurofibromin 1
MVQQYIWSEICKLDSPVVNIVLDELMRTAVDGPFGSRRSEIITDTVGTLSSINVRGRILSKLRKVPRRLPFSLICHSNSVGDR